MSENKMILPEKVSELSPVQLGWLKLSNMKTETFDALQKGELEIQGLLNEHGTMELVPLQEALKKAKTTAEDHKSRRLHFTNMLDEKLIKPAMEFEKRSFALIETAGKTELDLRKKAVEQQNKDKGLNEEKARLKTHITNEYGRIKTKYINDMTKAIADIYTHALTNKILVEDIPEYIEESIPTSLMSIAVDKPAKFELVHVDKDTARTILGEVAKYDPAEDMNEFIQTLREKTFLMYKEDLANAEVAVKAVQEQANENIATNTNEWALESATNTIMANTEVLQMNHGVTIKTKKKIVQENTEQYAKDILATFIKNWPNAIQQLGTKSWTKLVDPFTKALEKMDTKFDNLKYEEVCK